MELFHIINMLQLLAWVVIICLIIYFVFKRIEAEKNESFEDRDN